MNPIYQISEKSIPESQWTVRPGEIYNNLTIIGEPFWAKNPNWKRNKKGLICNSQFVKAKCSCGVEKDFKCAAIKCNNTKSCSSSCKRTPENRQKDLKKCTKCKKFLEKSRFGNNKFKKDDLGTECLRCNVIQKLKVKYGISIDKYENKLKEQNGFCAICRLKDDTVKNDKWQPLRVDHNHVTGEIRGLLCHRCNAAIGLLKEDVLLLKNAIKYLKKHHVKTISTISDSLV
jgi:hypothetical protein